MLLKYGQWNETQFHKCGETLQKMKEAEDNYVEERIGKLGNLYFMPKASVFVVVEKYFQTEILFST